jgi:hypothetical protein
MLTFGVIGELRSKNGWFPLQASLRASWHAEPINPLEAVPSATRPA